MGLDRVVADLYGMSVHVLRMDYDGADDLYPSPSESSQALR